MRGAERTTSDLSDGGLGPGGCHRDGVKDERRPEGGHSSATMTLDRYGRLFSMMLPRW